MKSIQDAIYNWLTIKVVADARPQDIAAVETEKMFLLLLKEEHSISTISCKKEDKMYYVSYIIDGKTLKNSYPLTLVEVMLDQINDSPEKYKIYPE